MAEGVLRQRLGQRGVDASVFSAGLTGEALPATEAAVRVAADLDVDISEHRSRLLNVDLVERADLVIGLAREHVREVVVLSPSAFSRTFTLKEAVRRGNAVGQRSSGEPFDHWLSRVHEGRQPVMHLGSSRDDDVDDPIGRRPAVYERVGDQIDELVTQLVELAWPAPTAPPPPDLRRMAST